MNYSSSEKLPAPCIVNNGLVVNKSDMLRLLRDVRHIRYIYKQDAEVTHQGKGRVMEVFSDPAQATLVASRSLYLNVDSFDYLEMITHGEETTFALVQDERCLCLTPVDPPTRAAANHDIDSATLEAIVTEALSASFDASIDDERNFFS